MKRELPPAFSVAVTSGVVEVRVRRSLRAGRIAIRHLPTGFELVVPARAKPATAEAFLAAQTGWIQRQHQKQPKLDSDHIWIQGVRLRIEQSEVRPIHVDFEALVVKIPFQEFRSVSETVAHWLRKDAKKTLAADVAQWSARMGLIVAALSIRDQMTKWGSCSSKASVSLNWRLIMCPPNVREYVVIHELAHLKHLNHGPKYWALVAEFCPDFQARRKWLRVNGHEIMAWNRGGSTQAPAPPDAD